MQVGLVGLGRMGQVLAKKLNGKVNLSLYDKQIERARALGIQATVVQNVSDLKDREIIILAVPDAEVINCVKELNLLKKPIIIINIATNVTRDQLLKVTEKPLEFIGVKIVGHAKQIALGERPVIMADDSKPHLLHKVQEVFQPIGDVISGNSDEVAIINTLAAKTVLEACVAIESLLSEKGIVNPEIVKSAISQVGAGTMKAYAEGDLGPFAREIVSAIRKSTAKVED